MCKCKHILVNQDQIAVTFWLTNDTELADTGKKNRLKTKVRKEIVLICGCFSLECTNRTDDNLLQLKGFPFYY